MRVVLIHLEDRLHLPVAGRADVRIAMDAHTEAALAVHKADDPLRIELEWLGGFLLIIRTGRIVTAHSHTLWRGCDDERVPPDARCFQHLASCTLQDHSCEGQFRGHEPRFRYLRHFCYSPR